ncbi:hypothetical protein EDB83DRAFT_2381884 [Lactarius deliciosus]|nr:hypothetical protein EDB83DRAFT_2381884 [Lactarius deliciosus]
MRRWGWMCRALAGVMAVEGTAGYGRTCRSWLLRRAPPVKAPAVAIRRYACPRWRRMAATSVVRPVRSACHCGRAGSDVGSSGGWFLMSFSSGIVSESEVPFGTLPSTTTVEPRTRICGGNVGNGARAGHYLALTRPCSKSSGFS